MTTAPTQGTPAPTVDTSPHLRIWTEHDETYVAVHFCDPAHPDADLLYCAADTGTLTLIGQDTRPILLPERRSHHVPDLPVNRQTHAILAHLHSEQQRLTVQVALIERLATIGLDNVRVMLADPADTVATLRERGLSPQDDQGAHLRSVHSLDGAIYTVTEQDGRTHLEQTGPLHYLIGPHHTAFRSGDCRTFTILPSQNTAPQGPAVPETHTREGRP